MPPDRPNCAIAKQLYDTFLAGDLHGILALLDPRIEWEVVGQEEVPHFGMSRGLDEVKRFFSIIGQINRVESFEVRSCPLVDTMTKPPTHIASGSVRRRLRTSVARPGS
jgi:ketosteroid isomerase-like protein